VNVTGNVQYPPSLSSNTSTVSGVTYTLSASTNAFTGTQYDMYKAFDRNNGTGWHSHGNYNSSNNPTTMGLYQGSNSLGGVNGEWIQLQMSSALPFGSVKVIGRQGYDPQASNSWEILASNNGSSWTSILQSTVHLTYNNGNGHQVTINNTTSYTHYAIIAKTVAGPSSAHLVIHEIEFYTTAPQQTDGHGIFAITDTDKLNLMRIKGGDNINISPPSHGVMTVALTHSPSLIAPTAQSPPAGDNTTRLATTAWVTANGGGGGGSGGGGSGGET
jgi:hypothetical protein